MCLNRLIRSLRMQRTGEKTVGWIVGCLHNRTTTIQLREFTMEPLETSAGVLQDSQVSPILYLFYNAGILEDAAQGDADTTIGE